MAKKKRICDRWKDGVCLEIAEKLGTVVFCPRERAVNCSPGQCCHHPLFRVRQLLAELKHGGINLRRYGKKLKDPAFVERLYSAFLKARSKRSTTASKARSSMS